MRLTAFHLFLPSKMRHNADGCKINASSSVQNAFIGYMGDTPALRPIKNDSCLGQIIGSLPLSKCHTQSISPSATFLRQLTDKLSVASSFGSLHCLKTPKTEYRINTQHTRNMNQQIILPSVALVNVTPGYTTMCPGFTLVGRARTSGASSLVTLYNSGLLPSNTSIMDVSKHLTQNITWFKTNWGEPRMQDIINYLHQAVKASVIRSFPAIHKSSLSILVISVTFMGLTIILIYCTSRRYRRAHHQTLSQ